ncbi:YhcN/YlaJ family sporulation lipoprotein [Bacillus sp. L381]|uniref:YhcN/YlaJ family sporulation lipoprotein n=1 Tax=Bacillus TaxID=1386 RepID=UPI00082668C1|nr:MULTISPECIES: YhcN/YlaJ family sporulation lipoprotein [Bacillus]AOC90896.1 putative lipoprotein YlaJ [Bacillus amyloliquefaciens]MCR9037995.1 YhcN/YlaJ family sporulation lipoprotein [Bacillus velezensis]QUN10903.1 YhcN/YlaJ family sporulation lipoprotein [Bacillus amyloliquefaciens]QYM84037.1 YhcN/YlaJ family sporulation lipoprotein [Bacillus sp. 7D3]QZY13217.1 YhcN/YlaJ family sporulation lipoprotein [Bacillus amyloliquefaciens]
MRVLFIIIQALFILTGCTAVQDGRERNIRNESTDQREAKPIHVKNTAPETAENPGRTDIAKHLVEVTEKIPGITDATAVVLGRYSVVGIDVDDNLERNKVESIKYTVAQALKNDPYGANAVVVADPDTVSRLRGMAGDIKAGRPVSGILDELAAIVGRVMPEVPNDVTDNEKESPTKSNNDQLNERDQKKLQNEQNDQSDHHMKNRQ